MSFPSRPRTFAASDKSRNRVCLGSPRGVAIDRRVISGRGGEAGLEPVPDSSPQVSFAETGSNTPNSLAGGLLPTSEFGLIRRSPANFALAKLVAVVIFAGFP